MFLICRMLCRKRQIPDWKALRLPYIRHAVVEHRLHSSTSVLEWSLIPLVCGFYKLRCKNWFYVKAYAKAKLTTLAWTTEEAGGPWLSSTSLTLPTQSLQVDWMELKMTIKGHDCYLTFFQFATSFSSSTPHPPPPMASADTITNKKGRSIPTTVSGESGSTCRSG
jgi:hypothetical protein